MDVGAAGGLDDVLARGIGLEAADVLGDGALHQVDALRQVTGDLAHLARVVVGEHGAIEPEFAAHQRPDAEERAGKRGLARAGGPEDAKAVAG